MLFGHRFFAESVAACARLNRRGILLSMNAQHIPRELPTSIIHVDYAPFSALLPRVAALVHHGGIGTTAQALRAGVSQLIMPLSHDQFDNATRVVKMNAGLEIPLRRYRAGAVAKTLAKLLESREIRTGCATAGRNF